MVLAEGSPCRSTMLVPAMCRSSAYSLATALESQGNVSDAAEEARRAARWVEALTTKLTPDLRPAFEELPLVREVLRARARLSS